MAAHKDRAHKEIAAISADIVKARQALGEVQDKDKKLKQDLQNEIKLLNEQIEINKQHLNDIKAEKEALLKRFGT